VIGLRIQWFRRESVMKLPILLLSLALTAIGITAVYGGQEPAPTSIASPTPEKAETFAAATAPALAPKAGGERVEQLTIALGALGTEAVDPILAILDDKPFTRLMYNYIIDTDLRDQEISKRTGLAEDWKWSEDRTALRVVLRKGVKFHHGGEVTTKDVVFSVNRLRNPETRAPYAATLLGPLVRMEIVNDYEMVFHLKQPSLTFIPILGPVLGGEEGMVYSKDYVEEVGEDTFRQRPVGSGPYKLVRREVGSFMEFEAFDDYFLGPPRVKKLIFRVVPEESTRIAMLKRGEADVVEVSRENVSSLRQSGFNIFSKAGGDMVAVLPHVWPELDKTFLDERVRKALFISINKEEINEFILSGQGKLTGNLIYEGAAVGGQPIPPHPYNPKEAARLLQEAGYGKGELQIHLYPALKTGYPEAVAVAEAVAADWERIGVKTKIVPMDYGTLRPLIVVKGGRAEAEVPSLRIHPWSTRALHGPILNNFWGCPGNLTVMCDPEVHAMIQDIGKAPSLEEYGRRQQAVAQVLYDRYMGTPLVVIGRVMAANDKVKMWGMGATAYSLNFRYLGLQGLLEK
jgi:peptide/nickel transport system substrate-binding protein